jgi:Uncharacterized Fe-S center protein
MHAVRNLRLCTKDCVCLFVCPTGATDTENGQIDFEKCLDGCRRCVDACPSHALSLVMDNYPSRPAKDTAVVEALMNFMEQKHREESLAKALAASAATSARAKLAQALAVSLRILAEDGAREAGYMIPQSTASKAYLEKLLAERPVVAGKQFPEAELRELLQLL